jgi:hypothetical protein
MEVLEFLEQCELEQAQARSLPKLPNTIIMDIIRQAYKSGTLDYHRRHIPSEHMAKVQVGIHSELLNQTVIDMEIIDEYFDSGLYFEVFYDEDAEDEGWGAYEDFDEFPAAPQAQYSAAYIEYMSSLGTIGIHELYKNDPNNIEYTNALNKVRKTTISLR